MRRFSDCTCATCPQWTDETNSCSVCAAGQPDNFGCIRHPSFIKMVEELERLRLACGFIAQDALAERDQLRAEIKRLRSAVLADMNTEVSTHEQQYVEQCKAWTANGYAVPHSITLGALRHADAEIRRLRSIVDKLPKTADGVAIVPASCSQPKPFSICGE